MGKFGEDLRMERVSRRISLEDITAITKINQRHLEALEKEQFRLLPGGILSKGIVRGYARALELDENQWIERFLEASSVSGREVESDDNWTAFAANVGKARILRHDSRELRLRWLGALLLVTVVGLGGFLSFRYYGVRAAWWPTVIPPAWQIAFDSLWATVMGWFSH